MSQAQAATVATRAPTPSTTPAHAEADAKRDPGAATLDSLSLLGPRLAAGLREVSRGESPLPASIPIPDSGRETCLRAVLAADAPVTAKLISEDRVLAVSEPGRQAWLDVRGPICLGKGAQAHIEVQGGAGPVRYVLWLAP